MLENEDICPWGQDNQITLDPHLLKREEKKYLGSQLAKGREKVSTYRSRYKMKAQTLYGYKRKVKKQLKMPGSIGRPSSLSIEAQQELVEMLRSQPEISEDEFRSKIRLLHREAWEASQEVVNSGSYKRISKRTVVRYSAKLRSQAFAVNETSFSVNETPSFCTCS